MSAILNSTAGQNMLTFFKYVSVSYNIMQNTNVIRPTVFFYYKHMYSESNRMAAFVDRRKAMRFRLRKHAHLINYSRSDGVLNYILQYCKFLTPYIFQFL